MEVGSTLYADRRPPNRPAGLYVGAAPWARSYGRYGARSADTRASSIPTTTINLTMPAYIGRVPRLRLEEQEHHHSGESYGHSHSDHESDRHVQDTLTTSGSRVELASGAHPEASNHAVSRCSDSP